jgi:transcriptional regulator with XRE-family HTH domain
MIILIVYVILKKMEQTYGERLAAAIKLKRLRQADFARKINITQTAVSKIINGTQYLDFDLAVKACEVLEISLDWLAYGIDMETKPPFYRNPERQRIEYLMTIMKEAEYPLVIVAMEEIIEIRLKDTQRDTPPGKSLKPNKPNSVNKTKQKS